jgi:hypothetical protein
MKEVQAAGETSSLQGEHPAIQNMKFINFFKFQCFIFALPDPDPSDQNHCGSGSATLPVLISFCALEGGGGGLSVFCIYRIADLGLIGSTHLSLLTQMSSSDMTMTFCSESMKRGHCGDIVV